MKINLIEIKDPKILINQLEQLHQEKYIFRGQRDSESKLFPNAFRSDRRRLLAKNFPITEEIIFNNWLNSPELENCIKIQVRGAYLPKMYALKRLLCKWLILLFHYNHELHTHIEKNKQIMPADQLQLVKERPKDYWIQKNTLLKIKNRAFFAMHILWTIIWLLLFIFINYQPGEMTIVKKIGSKCDEDDGNWAIK
ncbi:MAG: hypothetical protein K0R66_21 [Gammaproteobacteria bacterium]|jgi:hypothetical protein|nr:hypothetical protein [Gammaproteobacteria bacterium]